MKTLIWNIRGIGKPARVRQLKEIMNRENVKIIGLQETIKQSFSVGDLAKINPWGALPGTGGHLGALWGILLGVNEDNVHVENWEIGNYYVGVTIRDTKTNFRWDVIIVYGHAQHELSSDFLEELLN
jgi:hypothetical protein